MIISSSADRTRLLLCIGCVILLAALSGAPAIAHGGHGPASYDELDIRFLLPAGESGEVEFEMSQGETVDWDVRTEDGRPVDVEVHSHGFAFQRHEVSNATAHENGSFEAPLTGYYGILVEHRTEEGGANATDGEGDARGPDGALEQDVLVRMRIEGWFSLLGLVGIEPLEDEPVKESPALLFWWTPLFLGALGALVLVARRRE